jgi:hypothetical protein
LPLRIHKKVIPYDQLCRPEAHAGRSLAEFRHLEVLRYVTFPNLIDSKPDSSVRDICDRAAKDKVGPLFRALNGLVSAVAREGGGRTQDNTQK